MADNIFSGLLGSPTTGTGIFGKLSKKLGEAKGKADDTGGIIPAVPIGALVGSPMRMKGRGTRDTILNGSDGLPS